MEQLDYLIRTFSYQRSCLEQEMIKAQKDGSRILMLANEIKGIQFCLTQVYKLVQSLDENNGQ